MSSDVLFRSVLYIPGSKERALGKARSLDVDAIIFDLEDAVPPDEKDAARAMLTTELAAGGYGHRKRIVRINALDTAWGQDDARAAAKMSCDAVLLPKTEGHKDIEELQSLAPDKPIWCMMETPLGILRALEISQTPAVEGLVLGTNDLAKDIGCATGGDRAPLMTALQSCILAARAAGVFCIDGVYNAFKDDEGLAAECAQGQRLGMDGKTLIHPAQIAITNQTFAPTADQVDLATRQIEAFDAATARGEGVAVVDGSIVENLHIVTARAVLSKAQAVKERQAT